MNGLESGKFQINNTRPACEPAGPHVDWAWTPTRQANAPRLTHVAHCLKITISQSLELMARAFREADWNTLAAAIAADRLTSKSKPPPLQSEIVAGPAFSFELTSTRTARAAYHGRDRPDGDLPGNAQSGGAVARRAGNIRPGGGRSVLTVVLIKSAILECNLVLESTKLPVDEDNLQSALLCV